MPPLKISRPTFSARDPLRHLPSQLVAKPGQAPRSLRPAAPVDKWFTEGFDALNLQEAKALL
jgi:hypothetical protein